MKKHNLTDFLFSVFLMVFLFAMLMYLPSLKNDHAPGKTKVEHGVSTPSILQQISFAYLVAALPASTEYKAPIRIGYTIPLNDPKPDNTNYQLIRFKSLNLEQKVV